MLLPFKSVLDQGSKNLLELSIHTVNTALTAPHVWKSDT